MIIRPRYDQGTLETKWKVQQCQGEKFYFKFPKDCQNCNARAYCHTIRVKPFGVERIDRILVFADTEENAEQYAIKGHGRLLPDYREVEAVIPYQIKTKGRNVDIEPL